MSVPARISFGKWPSALLKCASFLLKSESELPMSFLKILPCSPTERRTCPASYKTITVTINAKAKIALSNPSTQPIVTAVATIKAECALGMPPETKKALRQSALSSLCNSALATLNPWEPTQASKMARRKTLITRIQQAPLPPLLFLFQE